MSNFDIVIDAAHLYYIADQVKLPTSETVALLHGMAIEHVEDTNRKAKSAERAYAGYASTKRKRNIPDSDVSVFFKTWSSPSGTEVKIAVAGNKHLKFSSSKIETFVTENILLRGEQ
jgi:hypothetical protein